MIRRLPVIPTLIVLVAVAIMVRLGFWQLDRLAQKEELLARYAAASEQAPLPWPQSAEARLKMDYRQSSVDCKRVIKTSMQAGRNAKSETGWSQLAFCETAAGFSHVEVVLGWSKQPQPVAWGGGSVTGTFRVIGQVNARIVADPPLAGLEANARPDPRDIPNNHLAYAVQWFLFALVALVIYALALRKRMRG